MLEPFATEYHRYRDMAEKTLAQVSDEAMNHIPVHDGNSMAMLVRHLSGNLLSRFTDFLTTDGEKPWRNRDGEFETRSYTREEVNAMWEKAWDVMEDVLDTLTRDDLDSTVHIRGTELPVHAALARSLSHLSYHVGQMVLMARMAQQDQWEWLTIPKGQSKQYNLNPTKEKGLR